MELNEVYKKIKEISARTANPRPQIAVASLAQELSSGQEQIKPHLAELKRMHLISATDQAATNIRLTLLGNNVNR